MTKEEFNNLWKNCTREEILLQFYYDYIELQERISIIKELREYLPKLRVSPSYELDDKIDNLEEILDKENK